MRLESEVRHDPTPAPPPQAIPPTDVLQNKHQKSNFEETKAGQDTPTCARPDRRWSLTSVTSGGPTPAPPPPAREPPALVVAELSGGTASP